MTLARQASETDCGLEAVAVSGDVHPALRQEERNSPERRFCQGVGDEGDDSGARSCMFRELEANIGASHS